MNKTSASIEIQNLFTYPENNTWLFTGGHQVQGGFDQTRGVRNYIGHFEEFIRWESIDSQKIETLQRYVINTGKYGSNIQDICRHFQYKVEQFHPWVISYMIGKEDFSAGEKKITEFRYYLEQFIKKCWENNSIVVIQSSVPSKIITENKLIYQYNNAARQVIHHLTLNKDRYIIYIDHYSQFLEIDTYNNYFHPNGLLNVNGHLIVANQLIKDTLGYTRSNMYSIQLDDLAQKEIPYIPLLNSIKTNEISAISSFEQQRLLDKMENKTNPMIWLFIGDSITHGASHTIGYNSFPQLFEKLIKEELLRSDDIIINTAVSGSTTTEFLVNVEKRFNKYNPDIVISMFGTNDCSSTNNVSKEQFQLNLHKIYTLIREKQAIAVFCTPNVLDNTIIAGDRGKRLPEYVNLILTFTKEKPIILADCYLDWEQNLVNYPYLNKPKLGYWINYRDETGIHPNANGQLQLFRSIAKALNLYKNTSKIENISYAFP